MIKIGILGSDSSHALAFAKLCNIPDNGTGLYHFSNIRITMIYGHDETKTKEVARNGQIESIATSPDELLGNVDAVMILFRDGNLHKTYATPFIKNGTPTWIDKPFTVNIKEGIELLEEATNSNCLITGGSTCKYSADVLNLKDMVDSKTIGNLISGYLNFPGDMNSPYNGLHFYGPHMAEMLFTIFGYDVKSVRSNFNNNELICVVNYDKFQVILNFTKEIKDAICILHGDEKSHVGSIRIDGSVYKQGFIKFIDMLQSNTMPLSAEKLIAPTILISAIEKSITTNNVVYFDKNI